MAGEQTRRRGAALESDILDAVWAELAEVGYARLTMEGVAARARTSKQVLYRRWHNRAELVLAAARHRVVSIGDDIPDTGTLRGDVLSVLRTFATRYQDFGPDVVHGVMSEARDLRPEFTHVVEATMTTILERAADRGEIRADVITPRLATLPTDLLRHEMLLTSRTVDEAALTEIVDDVFLPLATR
jgi:AcrR family transcriptional regulator